MKTMRIAIGALMFAGVGLTAAVVVADEPSVKKGVEEVGEAIKDETVKGYEKAKDATLHGTGTAVEKTGEGLNKAGEKLDRAGEKVKSEE